MSVCEDRLVRPYGGQEILARLWQSMLLRALFLGNLVSLLTNEKPDTLHTDGPIYLHTQTWSHQAIALYKKMGFTFIAENLDGTPNPDYEKVMQVLSKLDK